MLCTPDQIGTMPIDSSKVSIPRIAYVELKRLTVVLPYNIDIFKQASRVS